MTEPPPRLLCGRIGKAHGLGGEVYVEPISDDPERFSVGSELVHSDGRTLTVEGSHDHGRRFLVKFAEAGSRTQAESLRGELYVAADELRSLGDDEFWEHELVGSSVVDMGGRRLGTVEAVISGGAQDLLEVATEQGRRFVPVVQAIVRSVDREARRITVDPPPGLLE